MTHPQPSGKHTYKHLDGNDAQPHYSEHAGDDDDD